MGKIFCRTGRTVKRLYVRRELDEIAGNKSRRESNMAQQLNQEPARIAARTRAPGEGVFGCLHARFEANQIFYIIRQLLIKVDEKIDATRLDARNSAQIAVEKWG